MSNVCGWNKLPHIWEKTQVWKVDRYLAGWEAVMWKAAGDVNTGRGAEQLLQTLQWVSPDCTFLSGPHSGIQLPGPAHSLQWTNLYISVHLPINLWIYLIYPPIYRIYPPIYLSTHLCIHLQKWSFQCMLTTTALTFPLAWLNFRKVAFWLWAPDLPFGLSIYFKKRVIISFLRTCESSLWSVIMDGDSVSISQSLWGIEA